MQAAASHVPVAAACHTCRCSVRPGECCTSECTSLCRPGLPSCRGPRRCELAGLLRSISMRRTHHASLRATGGLLPRLRALLVPGAAGWVDLKASAKRILQASRGQGKECRLYAQFENC